ncbi:hypothetical protein XENOCAPTIV_022464 [Xenoophorus captivus]|uniref:Uncharacterized protein n=1 Tax=Xenoophorus captivus TaxID=1517983 RepID=A0ABV0QNV1_9TELE
MLLLIGDKFQTSENTSVKMPSWTRALLGLRSTAKFSLLWHQQMISWTEALHDCERVEKIMSPTSWVGHECKDSTCLLLLNSTHWLPAHS